MREQVACPVPIMIIRYTLTYNEGTSQSFYRASRPRDIPSHIMREQEECPPFGHSSRYTLTYNEGTLSIYAAFSRLKHLVVQIAQMSF